MKERALRDKMNNLITVELAKQGDIKRCIEDIRQLGKSLKKIGKRITPDIVGFYGELIVWRELKKIFSQRDYLIKPGSGQTRADFILEKNGRKIRIEIKSSRLKEEWFGRGYGYAINVKKCKCHPKAFVKHSKREKILGDFCYFDYLITLKLISEDLKKYELYVFPRELIEQHEREFRNNSKRFSSATHRIIFLEKPSKTKDITNFDRILNKDKEDYKNAWHLIVDRKFIS